MMWYTTEITVLFAIIIGMNAEIMEANLDALTESGTASGKGLKTRRIMEQMSAERIQDQQYHQPGGGILNEQLKWLGNGAMFNGNLDGAKTDFTLIPVPSKKSVTSRLCGTKLVDAIVKLCNGCVKPAGGKAVSAKRSVTPLMKRGQTLTEKCCINRCSFDDMKSFCCD